jgi:hypothetical protein
MISDVSIEVLTSPRLEQGTRLLVGTTGSSGTMAGMAGIRRGGFESRGGNAVSQSQKNQCLEGKETKWTIEGNCTRRQDKTILTPKPLLRPPSSTAHSSRGVFFAGDSNIE